MTKRTGKVVVTRDPRVCDGADTTTNRGRMRLKKCVKEAKWRIRVRGTEFVACDGHRNKGILLGPL